MSVPATSPRAVLWDLDGTLYHQKPLRWRMLLELGLSPLREGLGARRTLKRLSAFRKVREDLREWGKPEASLDRAQYEEPAKQLGDDAAAVERTVIEWMHERPLRHLAPTRREGIIELLAEFRAQGIRSGVFSDYPAPQKLEALGLADEFEITLCATDEAINAFKPHPRGFEYGCELFGLKPSEVLYVGDRDEVDGEGARAAGMPVCILDSSPEALKEVRDAVLG